MQISPNEVAYFAGLFDGEGCIRIAHRLRKTGQTTYTLEMILANTNLPVLLEIQKKWGGYWRVQKRAGIRDMGYLRWRSGRAGWLLRVIRPFLRIKRRQAELADEFISLLKSPREKAKGLSPDEVESRVRLHQKMAELNGALFRKKAMKTPSNA